jgi:tetratricopeptide (TPR) repeat protein
MAKGDERVSRRWLVVMIAILQVAVPPAVRSQTVAPDSSTLMKAMLLESDGKYKEAAPLYRSSLRGADIQSAFLGLERVYAELGWTDSLLAPLDSLLKATPADPIFRASQLRSLNTLGREADVRRAFDSWIKAAPMDPAPYREYARLLIQNNRSTLADTIMQQGQRALGSIRGFESEVAQVRAANGQWVESAQAWRTALGFAPELDLAAAYSLSPTPTAVRDSVRELFLAPPASAAPRLALARLEATWGSAANGWRALRELPPDSASVDAWIEFANRAEADALWSLARDAMMQVMKARPSSELALRTATDAMNAGDAAAVLTLIPLASAGQDSAKLARLYVPLHVHALAALGRVDEAERLSTSFDRWFVPVVRSSVTRTVAWGWVRRGNMDRARQALAEVGPEADSSDTAGWLALYDGDLRTARQLLRTGTETTPELALALGTIARVKSERAPEVGAAFLALARGDTVAAASGFVAAASATPDAASTLLAIAAQLYAARKDDASAIGLWGRIVEQQPQSAEAPEAELAWARVLLRKKDTTAAVARLEHLILTYPQSALLPQARRELDLAKKIIPEVADKGGNNG